MTGRYSLFEHSTNLAKNSISLRSLDVYKRQHLHDDDEQIRWNKGYNHCYVLQRQPSNELLEAAVLLEPVSGRKLTVETDLPGVLLYTGGYLSAPDRGVCLETQYFPDTPSHPDFPSCLLTPEKEYDHRTVYQFSCPCISD